MIPSNHPSQVPEQGRPGLLLVPTADGALEAAAVQTWAGGGQAVHGGLHTCAYFLGQHDTIY